MLEYYSLQRILKKQELYTTTGRLVAFKLHQDDIDELILYIGGTINETLNPGYSRKGIVLMLLHYFTFYNDLRTRNRRHWWCMIDNRQERLMKKMLSTIHECNRLVEYKSRYI